MTSTRPDKRKPESWRNDIDLLVAFPLDPATAVGMVILVAIALALAGGSADPRVFGIAAVVAAVVLVGMLLLPWLRARRLRALAAARGWRFSRRDEEGTLARLAFLELLDPELHPDVECCNALRGELGGGFQFTALDLRCAEVRSSYDQRWLRTVLLVESGWHTPRLVVSSWPVERAGLERVELELAEFNQRYHVLASDRRFAFAVLHPRAIEAVMAAMPPEEALSCDLHRGVLLVRREAPLGVEIRDLWRAEDYDLALGAARALFDTLPDFVRADHPPLRCRDCDAVQPRPAARCESCGSAIETAQTRAARRADRLSAAELARYGLLFAVLPGVNMILAGYLGHRWQRQNMKRRPVQLTWLCGAVVVIQALALLAMFPEVFAS